MIKFELSPAEQRGFFVLVVLIGLLITVRSLPEKRVFYDVSVYLPEESPPSEKGNAPAKPRVVQRVVKKSYWRTRPLLNFDQSFDPNYLSAAKMYKLGFPEAWIDKILSYKRENGYIEHFADFEALCAEDSAMIKTLGPLIAFRHEPKKRKRPKFATPKVTDINSAVVEDLTRVYGVGKVLAGRIIKFRDRLGGFHSKDQLFEVYGLDTSVVECIQNEFEIKATVVKYDINTASADSLSMHPYISRQLANSLVKYRTSHGAFRSIEDLSVLYNWKPETMEKIQPYLRVKDH